MNSQYIATIKWSDDTVQKIAFNTKEDRDEYCKLIRCVSDPLYGFVFDIQYGDK